MAQLNQEELSKCMSLFIENGLKSVTMQDIQQASNLSRKAIYEKYGSKELLIEAVLLNDAKTKATIFNQFREQSDNAIEEMVGIYEYFLLKYKDINPVLFFDLKKYYPSIFRVYQDSSKKTIFNFIIQNINRGIEEGLFRKDIDIDIVSKLWYSKLEIIMANELFPLNEYNLNHLHYHFANLHLRSIATSMAVPLIDEHFNVNKIRQ